MEEENLTGNHLLTLSLTFVLPGHLLLWGEACELKEVLGMGKGSRHCSLQGHRLEDVGLAMWPDSSVLGLILVGKNVSDTTFIEVNFLTSSVCFPS